mmetsp:Transcript_57185/g.121409  ORF Transcript_57185/g.121409 Transcript_57185/m.121409 type:complete len:254 (+) Transcript_57185:79-840(+)
MYSAAAQITVKLCSFQHPLLLLAPTSCLADDVLILPLVFTNDQWHLLLVNLFEAELFHDLFELILGIHGFLRHWIVEASKPLAPRGVLFQPGEWRDDDNDTTFVNYLWHRIQACHGVGKTAEQVGQNGPVKGSKVLLIIGVLREGTSIALEEIDLSHCRSVHPRLKSDGNFLSNVTFNWDFECQLVSRLHLLGCRYKIFTEIESLDMIEGLCKFKRSPAHCATHVQGPVVGPDRIESNHEVRNALGKTQPMDW